MKAQGSVELIVIVSFVAGFIVFVVVPWFSQAEYTLALSSARLSAHSFAVEHGYTLKQISFSEANGGKKVTFSPQFSRTLSQQEGTELRLRIYAGIASVFFNLNTAPTDQCLQGPTKQYCVV